MALIAKTKTNMEKSQERGIRVKYKYTNLVRVSAVENGAELPALNLPPFPSHSGLHLLCLPQQGKSTETVPGVLQRGSVPTEKGQTGCS